MSNVTDIKCIKYHKPFPHQPRAKMELVPVETFADSHNTGMIAALQVTLESIEILTGKIVSKMAVFMGSIRDDVTELNVIRLRVAEGDMLANSTTIAELHIPAFELVTFNERCRAYAIEILIKEFMYMILNEFPLFIIDADNKLLEIKPPEIDVTQLHDIFDKAVVEIFEYYKKRGPVTCK